MPPPAEHTDLAEIGKRIVIVRGQRATEMSIYVVRAFVKRRQFEDVYAAIRALMAPPVLKTRPIGFTADLDKE